MKHFRLLIVLIPILWAVPTKAENLTNDGYVSYEKLYHSCHAKTGIPAHATRWGTCFGYLSGIADAFAARQTVHGHKACIPRKVTMREVWDRMLVWMRKHPGNLISNASTMVARGLSEIYPCGQTGAK